jgi:hypothetical protein
MLLIPDILLVLFEFFPLKTLIAAQGVCQQWRTMVPMTRMLPARRALYDLYHTIIKSPQFLASRPIILPDLRPFDREGLVASLERQVSPLPDEFRCWLLEWPSKAVFAWMWPGFDSIFLDPRTTWPHYITPYGQNSLGPEMRPLWIRKIYLYYSEENPYSNELESGEYGTDYKCFAECDMVGTRGLAVWDHGQTSSTFIIIDPRQPLLHGTIHTLNGKRSYNERSLVARSWVQWLEQMFDKFHN